MPPMEQPLCQPRNWNPGRIFLSNFKTKHSRPREKGLERSVQTDTGGVKKDTCGVRQSIVQNLFSCPMFTGYDIAGDGVTHHIRRIYRAVMPSSPPPAAADSQGFSKGYTHDMAAAS